MSEVSREHGRELQYESMQPAVALPGCLTGDGAIRAGRQGHAGLNGLDRFDSSLSPQSNPEDSNTSIRCCESTHIVLVTGCYHG